MGADANLGNAANTVTLNGGALEANATFTSARSITLGGGAFQPDSGATLTLSGLLSGSGGLTLNGAGTLVLSDASNSYTGGNTITAGNLSVGADADLGAAANIVALNGGALETTATFTSTRSITLGGGSFGPSAATTLTLSGLLSGGGGLTLNGAGTLILSDASNSYTGGNTITAGNLSVGADADLGNATNTVTLNGGALEANATFASARNITLGGGAFQPDSGKSLTLSGLLSGSGGLTLNGAGTLILSDASNSYTGGNTITAGNLSVAADADLGQCREHRGAQRRCARDDRVVHVGAQHDAGWRRIYDQRFRADALRRSERERWADRKWHRADDPVRNQHVYRRRRYRKRRVRHLVRQQPGQCQQLGDGEWRAEEHGDALFGEIDYARRRRRDHYSSSPETLTLSGVVSGGPLSELNGAGTLVLTGTNTYTGGTTLQFGILQIGADANLGDASGALKMNSGGQLQTTATFTSARAVTLGGGTFEPSGATTLTLSGLLSGSGGLTLNGAGTLLLSDASNSYTGGSTITAGQPERGGGRRSGQRGQHGDAQRRRAGGECDVHVGTQSHAGRRRIPAGQREVR